MNAVSLLIWPKIFPQNPQSLIIATKNLPKLPHFFFFALQIDFKAKKTVPIIVIKVTRLFCFFGKLDIEEFVLKFCRLNES